MNKKFAAIGVMALTLTTCSTPTQAEQQKPIVLTATASNDSLLLMLKESKEKFQFQENKTLIENTIKELKTHVGKTWYVFSGSTPRGWDCSGLTMWFYEQMGISLKHSASAQKHSGKIVRTPRIGDIVAFGWNGYDGSGHVGIYIGKGLMIHSPMPGQSTRIEEIKSFAKYGFSKITYTRIIDAS
jgi:cell wall-associated NlpC family hydrolase